MLNRKQQNFENGIILSSAEKESYHRDGFLILKNFISNDICALLLSRAKELIETHDPSNWKSIFSTKNFNARDLYFLDSGDKIRFFFEEQAFNEHGELKKEKQLCINKIGHALHDLDPVFYCFSRLHQFFILSADLGVHDPLLIQSMVICKQPFIGGEVNCHQDQTFLFVEGNPATGLWLALEDATLENGCLWAIPGGHQVPLKSRMIREKNNVIRTEIYDDTPWELDHLMPLEVPRGSLIVLHGLLPHMSRANTSAKSRYAYALHIASGRDHFATNNWLQRSPEMPFRGFV